MKLTQLDLFEEPRVVFKPRYYKNLNIHERINVKGNSQGFAKVYLFQLRPGFDKMHIIDRYEHPEGPNWELIRWHLKNNSKSWKTILWREEENKRKLVLKLK